MEPQYTWIRIGDSDAATTPSLDWFVKRNKLPHIMEIMGPPICETSEFNSNIRRWIQEDTKLCISGELKMLGDGCPASNYRYKNDVKKNLNVIENYYSLFEEYSVKTGERPIYVITIPRDWRLYSWNISEFGEIYISDKLTGSIKEDTVLTNMLESFDISKEKMCKMRESCRGAKYNTYLIDMISFLYQLKLDSDNFHDIFGVEYRKLTTVKGGPEVGKWKPNKDMEYMYYDRTSDNDGYIMYTPKNESVYNIYKEFELAINPYENDIKKNIRNQLLTNRIDRWSDFDGNDIDDALTMLMLLHSFKGIIKKTETVNTQTVFTEEKYVMNDDEKIIYNSIERNMSLWFEQLAKE